MFIQKKIKSITIFVLIMFLISGGIVGLSATGVFNLIAENIGKTEKTEKSASQNQKKEIDISNVIIDENISEKIKKSDAKNNKKNIDNIKKEIASLQIDGKRLEKIYQLVDSGFSVPEILTAFRFLNEQYGGLDEMDILLNKKSQGISWSKIFDDYLNEYPEFKMTAFDEKELNSYRAGGLTTDDIMIADRLSQRGYESFEELIGKRQKGESWKSIKENFNVINMEEKLQVVSIDASTIKKITKENNISEEDAIEAIVLSRNLNVDEDETIKLKKSNQSKQVVLEKILDKKFNR